MKSLRESRIDRLARLAKFRAKAAARENSKKATEQTARSILKKLKAEEKKTCPHGKSFDGIWCFACRPDKVANVIRELWSPTPTYDVAVFIYGEDDPDTYLEVKIKTRNITQKLKDMQENGFWYPFHGKPVFMMPEMIRVVTLDGMAQSLGYSDLGDSPEPGGSAGKRRVRARDQRESEIEEGD